MPEQGYTEQEFHDIPLRKGSLEELVISIDQLKSSLEILCASARDIRPITEQSVVLHNITYYSIKKVSQFQHSLQQEVDIDILAWSVRNLFELNLVARFVCQSDENAKKYVNTMYYDQLQLIKSMKNLYGNDSDSESLEFMESAAQRLKAFMTSNGRELKKPMNMKDLAKAVGAETEYDIFYSLYSKYVHPSSFFVNSPQTIQENVALKSRSIFIQNGQIYAYDTRKRIAQAVKLISVMVFPIDESVFQTVQTVSERSRNFMFKVVNELLRSDERREKYLQKSFDEKYEMVVLSLFGEISAIEAAELCSVMDSLIQRQQANSEELKQHFLY